MSSVLLKERVTKVVGQAVGDYLWASENGFSCTVVQKVLEKSREDRAHLFMVLNLRRKYQVVTKLFSKCLAKSSQTFFFTNVSLREHRQTHTG